MKFLRSKRLQIALDVVVFGTILLLTLTALREPSPFAYAFVIALPVAAVTSTAIMMKLRADDISVSDLSMRNYALALVSSILLTATFGLAGYALGVLDNAAVLVLALMCGLTIGLNIALVLEQRRRSTISP